MVIEVVPSEDDDVSEVMPAMVDSCRSIGDATEAAIVSGLAPGSVAVMLMVGKSTRRQRRDGEQLVGEDAEHDDRRRDQRRHHRPADTGSESPMFRSPPSARARRHPRPVDSVQADRRSRRSRRPQVPSAITDRLSTMRATLTGRTRATPSFDDEHEGPGLAHLHGDDGNSRPFPSRSVSCAVTSVPGHSTSSVFGMVARTITMPVLGSTVFSIIETWPLARAIFARQ